MPVVSISGFGRIEPFAKSLGFLALRYETDAGRIVYIVAAEKHTNPLSFRLPQFREIRHRPIVEVRRSKPDAIEKRRNVAVGFHRLIMPDSHFSQRRIERVDAFRRPRIEPRPIRCDIGYRDDSPGSFSSGLMTIGALRVNRCRNG